MQFQHTRLRGTDGKPSVITVPDEIAEYMDRNPDWERIPEPGPDPEDLKGVELDKALEEAGLPKSGKADQKRARLADHAEEEQ